MSKRLPYPTTTKDDGAPRLWKSLEAKDGATHADAAREFPEGAIGDVIKPTDEQTRARLSRRGFLGFGAATTALLGEACVRRPVEKILPYSKAPEYIVPGVASHYATVLEHRGEAIGVLAESHEGRPTKLEGKPEHPSSLGASSIGVQALVMDLYDPDRSKAPRQGGKVVTWDELDAAMKKVAIGDGSKVRVLLAPTTSPTVIRLRKAIKDKAPHLRFHTWAPISESNAREGARVAFGTPMTPIVDYWMAKTIVSIDADFLQTEQGAIRAGRTFARGRKVTSPEDAQAMNRLYVADSTMSLTGANAEHRLRAPASGMDNLLRALAAELVAQGVDLGDVKGALAGAKVEGAAEKWVKAAAKDLKAQKGHGAVVVGRNQPPHVHALAHVINDALDNSGHTITYATAADPIEPADLHADLKALADDMAAGKVETLLILGPNPAYDGPGDVDFAGALAKVATSVHLSSHYDETGEKCTWHVPMAHELESWGDARSADGTWSIRQPLIAPLYGGRTVVEVLGMIAGEPAKAHDLVQRTFRESATMPSSFNTVWASALKAGVVKQSATALASVRANVADVAAALGKAKPAAAATAQNLEVTFLPCAKMHAGASANNPWLLELPDPLTKIVWDNCALVSIETAKALGVASGDLVTVSAGGKSVDVAAWVMPGQPDHTIALTLGWGRRAVGRFGNGRGFDVAPLRSAGALGFAVGAKVTKKGGAYDLVQTQDHHSMEGRPIAIDTTVDEYVSNPEFARYRSPTPRTLPLWQRVDYKGHKWGLSIDLNACTGCNACVVACVAENNIAFVGKDQVYRGREMHWIRIDRYFVGESESEPAVAFQPVACVQCEEAPCENVCPVNATAHGEEGLNDMSYNRCIGTRYCANNCPYKVRRFNYLNYWGTSPDDVTSWYGDIPETQKMVFNPNVTVRMRGVMEKCTYCVQRIEETKIAARRRGDVSPEGYTIIKDGSLLTACQQTCPADAISFGDLNDDKARVAREHKTDRAYALLGEIGTHPRTIHLGKIRNPNKDLAAPAKKKEEG